MNYPEEAFQELERQKAGVTHRLQELRLKIVIKLGPKLNDQAKEYALQGISRRVGILEQCIENIFVDFPVSQTRPLHRNALNNVQINLHAFVINLTGLLDNIAWVFVLQDAHQIHPLQIGLFKEKTLAVLPDKVRAHLGREDILRWHNTYAKDYRDALAHRIPLYVPPCQVTAAQAERLHELDRREFDLIRAHEFEEVERLREERDVTGLACPYFIHSFNGQPPVVLHPQLICDALTILELLDLCLEAWEVQ